MVDDRISKSPYSRGKRFMLLIVLSMFLIIWGIPLLGSKLGWSEETIFGLIGPLSVIWLLTGGIGSFLIGCPRCGKSLFMRGMWSVPWPARECSRCGNDLSVPGQSARKA